jgi:hypothetical protein
VRKCDGGISLKGVELLISKDGETALGVIRGFWPEITQQDQTQRLMRVLSLLMQEKGVSEASKELVIQAARLVCSSYLNPVIDMAEDIEKFRSMTARLYSDREAYLEAPIVVKRWKPVFNKPIKPPGESRVLAFCASPRKGGNTEVLVQESLRGAREAGAQTEYVRLHSLKIGYCTGCRKCRDAGFEGVCTVNDDMTDIYRKIKESDALIIGFPIYSGRESGQLTVFLDRCDCLARLLEPERRSLLIGTWGYPYDDTFDDVMSRIIMTMHLHHIETVEAISAGGFSGMLHGYDDEHKAMILKHPDLLHKAYASGRALVAGASVSSSPAKPLPGYNR